MDTCSYSTGSYSTCSDWILVLKLQVLRSFRGIDGCFSCNDVVFVLGVTMQDIFQLNYRHVQVLGIHLGMQSYFRILVMICYIEIMEEHNYAMIYNVLLSILLSLKKSSFKHIVIKRNRLGGQKNPGNTF